MTFWLLPVAASALLWALRALSVHGVSVRHRVEAILSGTLATIIGLAVVVATVGFLPFAVFFPLMFIYPAVALLIVWFGFLGMWSLSRLALTKLGGEDGAA